MTDDASARDLAARALIFIAQEPDRIGRFLAQSGAGPSDIRARAQDPAFQGGILDHLLSDEALLTEFAEWAEIEPATVGAHRRFLPGGETT
jgi:hypothetical protein